MSFSIFFSLFFHLILYIFQKLLYVWGEWYWLAGRNTTVKVLQRYDLALVIKFCGILLLNWAFSIEDVTIDPTSLKCSKHDFEGKVSPQNRDSNFSPAL